MRKPPRADSVFLNVPYDAAFEDLYVAYVVGLTQLGLRINVALAVSGAGRLDTIISLIEQSRFSIHDLSRIELRRGLPRFNMPLELGLALYHSKKSRGAHRVHIFDRKLHQAQRSVSDVNSIDAQIHGGSPRKLMIGLRNIFEQTGRVTSVPGMFASYQAVRARLPAIRKDAGNGPLFEAAIFQDLVLAALVESERRTASRAGRR